MSFFESITLLPDDPILQLPILFNADPRPKKVNLGIGSYKNEEGRSLLLPSVRKAETMLIAKEQNKDYLPIEGDARFIKLTSELTFGQAFLNSFHGGFFAAQTPGGTPALRVGAEFLVQEISKVIFIPTPTWPNHKPVFTRAGLNVHSYKYYNEHTHRLDFAGMCSDIANMPPGSVLLLHASCHNPTGIDPSFEQWQELSSLIKQQKIIPFFDFAYQGFKDTLEEDARPVRFFAEQGHEMLVANSYSKNFGLYGERVGSLSVLSHNKEATKKISSQIKQAIRGNYSNPPRYGASIVTEILQTESLKNQWIQELSHMRQRMKEMRHALIQGLQTKANHRDWSFMERQHGFFSFSGLNLEQVKRLIEEFGVYMPANGRLNVAGLNTHNLDYVVEALAHASRS